MGILFLLTIPLSLFGQKQYEKGFVVLNNQDTLYGFVRDRKPSPFGRLYKKIRFKGEKGRSKYGPEQIRAYRKGGIIFESVWMQETGHFLSQNYTSIANVGEQRFLKVVVKGYLTYYQWEFEDADSDYIDAIDLFKKKDDTSLIRVTQGLFGLKRKSLKRFFKDCPPLVKKLEKKEFKHPIDVANFYNSWKGSQSR
ncbi:hypothetical protein FGM00_18410 [Aggregatimonas sangjinii]|uniref:Uncharacterized protein n=1 Tax=Aggregatimonas sangjinii TaxID=2583587 RepID=A0A5B7SXH2_9FLAO|nr:hypothetical protein [Aggregatimonas sangjinii]QCX01989.1 hypothetical protein FGM00_18410 [Aggregatimonas sangjinii]